MLSTKLLGELETFSVGVVARMRAALPSYEAVPAEEHLALVRGQMRQILEGVAHGHGPDAAALATAADLGWRRAAQGVPLEDVMEAYHHCYREMWSALVALADDAPARSRELVTVVDVLWSWTHGLSAAVAKAHAEAGRTRFAEHADLRRRFFAALAAGAHDTVLAERLAASLGFDPRGAFRAVAVPDGTPLATPVAGAAQSWSSDGLLLALLQDTDERAVLRADGPAGVGAVRQGLAGAVTSLDDARRALALAEREGSTVRFEDEWLLALLQDHRDELADLLAAGVGVARSHPRLAEAVTAFAGSRFRITECAARLHLHPNSIKSRLDRWRELTGWDPQTMDGLARSVIAIRLACRWAVGASG